MSKVSIIVPVYNVEKYLRRCVDSILAQTFTDFECILIDDGSPDGSPAICDEYAKKDNRIKVIHQENSGVSAARNAGLDVARGEWIGFVDSDDWVENNFLETLMNLKDIENYDILQFNFNNINPTLDLEVIPVTDCDLELTNKYECPWWFGMCWTRLYKKSLIIENKINFPIDIKWGEDTFFSYMSLYCAKRIRGISKEIYNYFHHNDALVQNIGIKEYISRCKALNKLNNALQSIETEKKVNFPLKKEMQECKYWMVRKGYFTEFRTLFPEWNFIYKKDLKMLILSIFANLHLDFVGKILYKI